MCRLIVLNSERPYCRELRHCGPRGSRPGVVRGAERLSWLQRGGRAAGASRTASQPPPRCSPFVDEETGLLKAGPPQGLPLEEEGRHSQPACLFSSPKLTGAQCCPQTPGSRDPVSRTLARKAAGCCVRDRVLPSARGCLGRLSLDSEASQPQ